MLYRVYLHMLNQTNYNRLNLDQFVVGDPVIIKLKRFPTGNEYYGILYQINNKTISIIGKPLSWVLAGDLKLDQYTFNTNSIDDVQPFTREAAEAAREKAENIKYEIKIKELYDRLWNNSFETGATPFLTLTNYSNIY